MATVRDFLERLRPSGTPGAPSISGVPADRDVERTAELDPVFARLVDVQAEAERIRTEAVVEAGRRRAAVVEVARSIVAEARRRAEAERGASAAAAQAEAAEQAREIATDAQRQAAAIADAAARRLPALVDIVVTQARDALVAELEDAR